MVLHWFRQPAVLPSHEEHFRRKLSSLPALERFETELCFNIELSSEEPLSEEEQRKLFWLLSETYEPQNLTFSPAVSAACATPQQIFFEIGPRLSFTTSWSSNAGA